MQVNDTHNGFILKEKQAIAEFNATAYVFEYEKTGTPVIYLSCPDNNKVFQIAFRTPNMKSTGVAHILEHSVLCGSRKYPVKEPFVELAKGSMNTFLNAMTYPDKTVYPIASTNDKDFMNLMDVYLDAVFYPDIDKKPEIFLQEGWHDHLENTDDPLTVNGVVYNEMKGVYSDPEQVVSQAVYEALYPQSVYGFESGGHPDDIPTLTYRDFLDFHHNFYHPSNAFIYFYGDGDVLTHLDYLADNYLSAFYYHRVDSVIALQPPFEETVRRETVYPVSPEEEGNAGDYIAYGRVLGSDMPFDRRLAFDILFNVLLGNDSAPLKKAILDLGLCEDIDYSYVTALRQPSFTLLLKNADASREAEARTVIRETLSKLAADGLDPADVAAAVNSALFTFREQEFGTTPKGLILGLEMLENQLYDTDPLICLGYEKAVANVKKMAENGGLEALITDCLLDNPHGATVIAKPDGLLASRQAETFAGKMAERKENLSPEDLNHLVRETEKLKAYQEKPDSPEALATIPKLALSEIDPKAKRFDFEEESVAGRRLLWHPLKTEGITHLSLYFDTDAVAAEDVPTLSLLNKLLFRLGTANRDVTALNRDIDTDTGGITTVLSLFPDVTDPEGFTTKLLIKGKALDDNVDKMGEIITDVLTATRFDDTALLTNILRELTLGFENKIMTAGNAIAAQRLKAQYSGAGCEAEAISGLDFYRFIKKATVAEALTDALERIYHRVLFASGLTVSLACAPAQKERAMKAITNLIDKLPRDGAEGVARHYAPKRRNEGILTPSKINYAAKGFNLKRLGYAYDGALCVLKNFLAMDYLWNNIRIKGGAYGAGMALTRAGDIVFSSYRDPHVGSTFAAFDGVGAYLRGLDLSQRELEKQIIGSISAKDVPLSEALTAAAADSMAFTGLTQAMIDREREEILGTTVADLKAKGEMIDALMAENVLCAVGSEAKIKENGELFDALITINQ